MPLALGNNNITRPLTFIEVGQMWLLMSATIGLYNPTLGWTGTCYGAVTVCSPSGSVNSACQGPLWRTGIGIDENNQQVPAFHGDYLNIAAYDIRVASDVVSYSTRWIRVI